MNLSLKGQARTWKERFVYTSIVPSACSTVLSCLASIFFLYWDLNLVWFSYNTFNYLCNSCCIWICTKFIEALNHVLSHAENITIKIYVQMLNYQICQKSLYRVIILFPQRNTWIHHISLFVSGLKEKYIYL